MTPIRGPSAGDVFKENFAATVDELIDLDGRLRSNDDPENLHAARVAVRRLRSYLRTFMPVLDLAWAGELRERLSWLNRCFADARDLDVLVAMLERRAETAPAQEAWPPEVPLDRLRAERAAKHAAVQVALREERYADLVRDLFAGSREPRFTAAADEPARKGIRRLLSAVWKKACKRVRKFEHAPTDAELHKIRIAAKHVRYFAECFAPLAGKRAASLARQAQRMQTALGERHDAVMAVQRLQAFCEVPQGAFVTTKGVRWRGIWGKMRSDYQALRG